MSAQDNLGRQWQQPELSFTVHRGLTRKPQKGRWLGMHWSADPAVARKFAGPFGHVIHGEIPMSSVETDTNRLRSEQVFLPDNEQGTRMEKEVSATIGKPVKVTGMTGPEADKKTGAWNGRRNEGYMAASGAKRPPRKRTYKNPREMTA
jgi:hypothetical protein